VNIIKTNFQYLKPLIPLDLTVVRTIIIHHAEAFIATPEDIHRWHIEEGTDVNSPMYGCSGFGYGFYVRKDGSAYEGRGFNIGAQCAGMNSKSIGICCEGNWEKDSELPESMMISLINTINYIRGKLPGAVAIEPHMKFYPTECPGRFLFNALPRVRECADAFSGIDKCATKKVYGDPAYWKRCAWLNLNPNSDYYRKSMINANMYL
jgi:hypothetical protein